MTTPLIKPLAAVPELMPMVRAWFEAEWPDHYRPGGRGDAERDVSAYCRVGSLPIGVVAFLDGEPSGFAALRSEPFPTHPQLSPWVGAAYVIPSLRRRGIGRALLVFLEAEGFRLGYTKLYCATATSASLLLRCGWQLFERVSYEGTTIGLYERAA